MKESKIRKLYLILLFIPAVNVCVAEEILLKPFTSDGCSLFPEGTSRQNELWLKCCVAHDKTYWLGGTYQERLAADKELRNCVYKVGEPVIAELMLAGVRVGGSPYWPTEFRWGYGWNYIRGYKKLTPEEIELAKKIEQQAQELLQKRGVK